MKNRNGYPAFGINITEALVCTAKLLLPLLFLLLLASFGSVRNTSRHVCKPAERVAAGDFVMLLSKFTGAMQTDTKAEGLKILDKCVSLYADEKSFSMDVEYSVFFNHHDFNRPDDKQMGKIVRHKDNFFQEESGNIKIINKKYEFVLNERAQYLTISDRRIEELKPVEFHADSLDKLVSQVEKTAGGFFYHIAEGAVEKFEVITDEQGFLKTWRTWYREPMDFGNGKMKVITQMRYLNFEKKPKIHKDFFSLEPYISIGKKGEVSAKEKYKAFRVLNQLSRR